MAKKPATGPAPSATEPPTDTRKAAIAALMALAAERDWHEIGLADIAERAGLTLAGLRAHFPSKGAILAAFSRDIDEIVLDGIDPSMAGEPARERLFDTLMRRIDALSPYKTAVGNIFRAFERETLTMAAWNRVAVNSMQWMLAAAAIEGEGPLGALRAQGLAIAWPRIIRVWLDDEDEGLARTMTAIDRQLRAGERWMERMDDLWHITRPFWRLAACTMRRRSHLGERVRRRFEDVTQGRHGRRRRRERGDEAEAM
jgi:AcrR family transcriptional regulator